MMLQSIFEACRAAAPMLANHLWQSTWFAVAVGTLTLAFRKNRARIRFALWLAVSVKFLVPFSLLVSLGAVVSRPHPVAMASPSFYAVFEQASQPFAASAPSTHAHAQRTDLLSLLPGALAAAWICGFLVVTGTWWMRWRRIAALVRSALPLAEGREVEALRQLEQACGARAPVPLLVSQQSMEPGVFGILRPVLLWPAGISQHLPDPHLRSILAHELEHVRRRDNLAAALHMLVEAVFWFHPAVWWVGAELVEERERACDEQVLRLGNQPSIYAESILRACKFCVEAPLTCVSGVAGSNLKRRIVRIMNQQLGNNLSIGGKLLLAAIGLAAISAPVAVGVFNAPQLRAQQPQTVAAPAIAFDAVSVRPSTAVGDNTGILAEPNKFTATGATVQSLISFAYGVQDYQVLGAPDWIGADHYDIDATWKDPAGSEAGMAEMPPPLSPRPPASASGTRNIVAIRLGGGQLHGMLQTLLAQKFNLKFSRETRDLPIYNLVVAPSGSRLTPTPSSPPPPVAPSGKPMISVRVGITNGNLEFAAKGGSSAVLAALLSEQLHRKIVDKTGLAGQYDIDFHLPQGQSAAQDFSAALEDQLGLRLEPAQAPVDVLVVQQVEKPAEN